MPSVVDAWPALLLLGVVLLLPFGAGWLKQRGWVGLNKGQQPLHVVSVLAVGPQQKVVTVEVVLGTHRKWLVLGVTPQSVTTLDHLSGSPVDMQAPPIPRTDSGWPQPTPGAKP
jgi:flagellar biogenesis protein FliO